MTTAGEALKRIEAAAEPAERDAAAMPAAHEAPESKAPESREPENGAIIISLADGKPLVPAAADDTAPLSADPLPPEPLPPEPAISSADDASAEAAAAVADALESVLPPALAPPAADLLPAAVPSGEAPPDDAPPRPAGPLFVVPSVAESAAPSPPLLPSMVAPGAARIRAAANPLLAAAGPAMAQARRLSEAEAPADPEALGFELTRLLADFEAAAVQAGLPPGTVQVGRFALAATLDDLLRACPWAAECGWLRQGLAAAGPERFFDLMRAMLKNPARHRHALELFYACLSLGFEGRFRDRSQGGHELSRIRDQLYRVLRRLGEAPDRALSPAPPKMRTVAAAYRPPSRAFSPAAAAFWLVFLAMLGSFAAAWWLDARSAALAARLEGMISELSVATARPAPLPPPAGPELAARVTEALAPDIRAAAVEVLAGADGALVVRLSGGAMFPAGSDAVRAFYRAVLDRIALALAPEKGRVLVVAHTDAWALATEKFPTARALTEARAEAVRALLEKRLGGLRLSAEGRGDGEPIDSNDTPGGRAANRRVDIRLYP